MKFIPRRKFIFWSSLLPFSNIKVSLFAKTPPAASPRKLIAVATWTFGKEAADKALEVMISGGSSLDGVVAGANIIEADPDNASVGIGGLPDADGAVTLDAAVMDWKGNAGAVAFLKNILHPISVARMVMEKTKHVMLAGEGALEFALRHGFKEENLLTEKALNYWKKKSGKKYYEINDNHDTIGILAIDKKGNLSAGVSTSGSALKIHGRIGDSPIIGAGLFADNGVGGAVATGTGELSMKTLGCFLIVEKMREGYTPQEACEIAVKRAEKYFALGGVSISYLALSKSGEIGAYSSKSNFTYAAADVNESKVYQSKYFKEHPHK